MPDQNTLTFYPWHRSELFETAKPGAEGRLAGQLDLRLTETHSGRSEPHPLTYHLMAARDIKGLQPGAILRTAPAPFTRDAETTKLVHVDLRDPDLPWRYTPRPNPGADQGLSPWIVVLVGTAEEITIERGEITHIDDWVLATHDLEVSSRWAHVQEEGDSAHPHRIARLLSPRGRRVISPTGDELPPGLAPQTEYIAAIVPAFDDDGLSMWEVGYAAGSPFVTRRPERLPVYYSWRFWTAESGDFETLARAIQPRPGLGLGRAVLHNPRVMDADGKPVTLEVRGAISSLADEPDGGEALQRSQADLDVLNNPVEDTPPDGAPPRVIIGLPDYGPPWLEHSDAAVWGRQLNEDPRFRGIAGLGVWMGIEAQEELVQAVVAQMGALPAARQRIGHLALGLAAARRLWDRRLPPDTARRLRIFGPAMRRMRAANGSVLGHVTGENSPLAAGLFASAAQRVLRRGTARTRYAPLRPADLLNAAKTPPPPPAKNPPGLPHSDSLTENVGLPLLDTLDGLMPLQQDVLDFIDQFVGRIIESEWLFSEFFEPLGCSDAAVPYLQPFEGQPARRDVLIGAVRHCMANPEVWDIDRYGFQAEQLGLDIAPPTDLNDFLIDLTHPEPASPYRTFDLDRLADAVGSAINPHAERPPAWRRVAAGIDGLEVDDLTPPEIPIGIDFPTWTLLNKYDKEWLLPGVGQLETHSVVAMQTNPRFISGFMVGINSQFINEMHWRNLPVDRRCTPLLMFWGQLNFHTQQREPDIQPLADWDPGKELGDLSHQYIKPPDPTGRQDVVLTFRTDLFRRYPSTLVYLTNKGTDDGLLEPPQLDLDDAALDRTMRAYFGPIFQGMIEPDIVFFAFDVDPDALHQYWLVLDEPPAELRFRNDQDVFTSNGAVFAAGTIDRHSRVAFSGAYLHELGLIVESTS